MSNPSYQMSSLAPVPPAYGDPSSDISWDDYYGTERENERPSVIYFCPGKISLEEKLNLDRQLQNVEKHIWHKGTSLAVGARLTEKYFEQEIREGLRAFLEDNRSGKYT
ncbi:uncharacterized protein I206_101410 [Kwoniella pini CBS 10737]|uniref:Uncharacterized protein n=1 Tax=Kwoniella pini CBS 10737 TaxID=1296096 RepID=A0A1B9HWR4_9TREE|nr:uncharacterized protein I206_06620 [Kwoniella pini CBS 10737]OCF47714.1 hypothetical protein I206_06620 [Kwoniella pini CBS 10737]